MKTLMSFMRFMTKEDVAKMADLGLDVTIQDDEKAPVEHPEQYEAVICVSLFKFNPIESFTNLKFIQLLSAGYEFMPLDYLAKSDIFWRRAENVHGIPMAELALGGVLALYRGHYVFNRMRKERLWRPVPEVRELAGKKVCVVGAGQIGTECAKRFQAMGCPVTGIARTARECPYYEKILTVESMASVLPDSDIVILALPGGSSTDRLFDRKCFDQMKKGSVFVNIGRGTAAEEEGLVAALQSGKLFGAVTDVYENEPLRADSPLWDMENVVFSPHCAASGEVELKSARLLKNLTENLAEFRKSCNQ